MVFVKVRETYDLHTVKNKMTVIGIHTPKPDIIKRNYPGLLMQCRAYRPVSADVRLACASMLPLDPLGVGTSPGDVAPEDVFNPILYKAMSNKGMSQLEARINHMTLDPNITVDVAGQTAFAEVDETTSHSDEFPVYYGLLSQTGVWKHANPQVGLQMSNLTPYVYEKVWNVGDQNSFELGTTTSEISYGSPLGNSNKVMCDVQGVLGKAKPFPFLNTTGYTYTSSKDYPDSKAAGGYQSAGFPEAPANCELDVPYLKVMCGCIIIPPSRLHELFFRLVCEWTLEFSSIRPISEITNFGGVAAVGTATHYQNYSYEETKQVVTGDASSELVSDSCMVSANVDVTKVM